MVSRYWPVEIPEQDIPLWMRQTRREVDWPIVVIIVLCAIVGWPLLVRPGIPQTPSFQAEVSRTVEMAEGIQAGVFYPRWASDFNYGYGSPLWNYLAPLPHYASGLHYVLSQRSPETSIKLIMAASLALIGIGLFGFVRQRWGSYAALLAATAYLLSPQIVLVKPYLEGDLGGLLALGLFLLALWAFDRLVQAGGGVNTAFAALALAGLVLTQTPLNIVLSLITAGWWLWLIAVGGAPRFRWRRAALAFGLGVGLAAFYWLPAWLERDAAKWRSAAPYPVEAWHRLSPGDLLALPARLDMSAINPPPTNAIGPAIWLLALAALAGVFGSAWRLTHPNPLFMSRGEIFQQRLADALRVMPSSSRAALYFALVGVALTLLTTPLNAWFWETLPGWPPFYPRHLIPVIALCGALVAGQLGVLIGQARRAITTVLGMTVALTLIAALALPTLIPPAWPWSERHAAPTLLSVLDDEIRGHLAVTPGNGWLLPSTAADLPAPSPALRSGYQNNQIDKVAREALPAAAQVDVIVHRPHTDRLIVDSARPVTITLLTFAYPGWSAKVDGRHVPIRVAPETGFIMLPVPPGRHEVVIHFGGTLARSAAWVWSGLSAGALLVLSFRRRKQASRLPTGINSVLTPRYKVTLIIAALLVGAVALLPRLVPEKFTLASPPGVVLPADQQLPRPLQGGLDFLAFDVSRKRIRPGGELAVTLYWRAWKPDLPDYQVELSIVDAADPDNVISFAQHRHPGMIPSSRWPLWPLADYYVRDTYYLQMKPNAAPGEYNIIVQVGRCQSSLLPCETIDPLFVSDERARVLGQRILLPVQIAVELR